MTANEARATQALRSYWWSASPLRFSAVTSFDGVIASYQARSPSFLENLGSSLAYAGGEGRIRDAFAKVAKEGGNAVPPYQVFFQALIDERLDFTYEDLKDVAKGTAQEIGEHAKIGLGIFLAAAGAGVALYLLARTPRGKSA